MIDAGDRPVAVAAKQIERSPAERGGVACSTVEERRHVIDEALPPPKRHVAGRTVRMQAGEAFDPSAENATVVLDDRSALFLGHAPLEFRPLGLGPLKLLKLLKFPSRPFQL